MIKKSSIAVALALSLVASISAQQNNGNQLPEIGTAGSSVITIDKEQVIGDVIWMQVQAQGVVINDPLIDEYINDLGNKLVRHAQDVKYKFNFFVLRDPSINAFALFGGVVGMHTGTILASDSESELASVMGHEIAHVTQRHLARSIEAQQRNAPITTLGAIASVLMVIVNPEAGMAGLSSTMAGGQQARINYTRNNEKEADRVGMAILSSAGYDPMGAPQFFSKLAERYRYSSKPPPMLLTHPMPESRISEARIRAEQYSPNYVAPSLPFYLTQARIAVRFNDGDIEDKIETIKNNISKKRYVLRQAEDYALALAYLDDKRYEEAKALIDNLLDDDPKNLFYIDTNTDILLGMGRVDEAIKLLAEMYTLMPNNQVVTLNYANALITANQPDIAIDILKKYIANKGSNLIAFELLIAAFERQSNKIYVHEYKGERLAFVGAFQPAVDEFQTALQFALDQKQEVASKRLKARIQQVREREQRISRLKI